MLKRPMPFLVALALVGCSPTADHAVPVVELSSVRTFAGTEQWGAIHDVLRLETTTLVLGSSEPFVHVLRDDTVVAAWGENGEGPRQLGYPARLVRLPGGDAGVWDAGKRALFALTDSGLAKGVPLGPSRRGETVADIERTTYGDPYRIGRLDQRWVMAGYRPGIASQDGYWHGSIVSLAAGAQPDEHVIVRLDTRFGAPPPPRTSLYEIPLWDVCPDGVAVFDPHTGRIRLFAADGAETGRAIPRPPQLASRRVSDVERRAVMWMLLAAERQTTGRPRSVDSSTAGRMIESSLPSFRESVAPTLPRAIGLRCTDEGVLWLRAFDEASGDALGRGRTWLRFDGSWSRVLFPAGFTPLRFGSQGAWGFVRSEENVESPAYVAFGRELSSDES